MTVGTADKAGVDDVPAPLPANIARLAGSPSCEPDVGYNTAPLASGFTAAILDSGSDAAPLDSGFEAASLEGGSDAAPLDSEYHAAPLDGGCGFDAAPLDVGFDAAPTSDASDAAPPYSEYDAAPLDGGSWFDAAPLDVGFDAAPTADEFDAASPYSGSDTAPLDGGSDAAPRWVISAALDARVTCEAYRAAFSNDWMVSGDCLRKSSLPIAVEREHVYSTKLNHCTIFTFFYFYRDGLYKCENGTSEDDVNYFTSATRKCT